MHKVVMITGAARGIGSAMVGAFAAAGWKVLANCRQIPRDSAAYAEICVRYPEQVEFYPADVTERQQVDRMVERCVEKFGAVDLLINNAGVAQSKLFIDLTEADWDLVFNTNLKAVFHCTQSVLRYMLSRKEGQIINIASIWGLVGASCEAHYAASKSGVIGLTKSLAKELGPSNIRVNCIAPGIIKTDMLAGFSAEELDVMRQETPLQQLGQPADVAACALFLASAEAGFFTGQVLSPNGGMVI